MLQARNRDASGARKSFARALEIDPTSMDAVAGMAALDVAEKRPEAARARADALVEKMPKSAPALVFAAGIHGGTGDWTRAEALLKTAIETDPASLDAYSLLGQLYTSQNRLDAARETFGEVVKKRPEHVSAHTLIALIDEMEGNTTAARQRYERIVQIDPNAAVACNNLAYIYAEHGGNLDVAVQLAQRARQRLPDAPQIADTLGWVYYRKGLAQLAVPMFQQAVVKLPKSATYRYHLALAYRAMGDRKKAREAFTEVIATSPESREAGEARRALSAL